MKQNMTQAPSVATGWASRWTLIGLASLLFLTLSGFAVTLAPFHPAVEWGLLLHTLVGLLMVVPLGVYLVVHWLDYRRYNMSDSLLLGYIGTLALFVCLVSGLVVTWQGLFATRMSPAWRDVHLWSTVVAIATSLLHILLVVLRDHRGEVERAARSRALQSLAWTGLGVALAIGLGAVYSGPSYVNEFPEDYSLVYGEDRPFAPSLAVTSTGSAFDSDSLAGSRTCGTANCHTQIVDEWLPSAHRYCRDGSRSSAKCRTSWLSRTALSRRATVAAATIRSPCSRGPRTSLPRISPDCRGTRKASPACPATPSVRPTCRATPTTS